MADLKRPLATPYAILLNTNGFQPHEGRKTTDKDTSERLKHLYANNLVLKIWKVAIEHLSRKNPPITFPETVPQSGKGSGTYLYRPADFWTCGFFPGSLYCLLERSIKWPQYFLHGYSANNTKNECRRVLKDSILQTCRDWAQPLHEMAKRKDTHDIGFIVEPALRRDYELTGNPQSLQSILTAAESLASRYDEKARAIRSWDTFVNKRYQYTSKNDGILVIIDSMCNLDLLYYAGYHSSSQRLIDVATIHAHTVLKTHLRKMPPLKGSIYPQYSTYHVANLCSQTGRIQQRMTAQGYSDESTWARGQAWAILGYAQTYSWTKDPIFLETACGLAEHFIHRMESAPACVEAAQVNGHIIGRYVPVWDFDAPIDKTNPLRDSSAGVIAANGLLVLHGALLASGYAQASHKFFQYAMRIVQDTLDLCCSDDQLDLILQPNIDGKVEAIAQRVNGSDQGFDGILTSATANFNGNWKDRYSNHGLVYGDYYLLEFGNRLLQMGLVSK